MIFTFLRMNNAAALVRTHIFGGEHRRSLEAMMAHDVIVEHVTLETIGPDTWVTTHLGADSNNRAFRPVI